MLDSNGQPDPAFNRARNRRKGLKTLLGIMDGITSDWQIVESEALFLATWLREHDELLTDPDAREVFEFARYVLAQGSANAVALCDMRGTIHSILERRHSRESDADEVTDAMNRLIGMVHGVTADRCLSDREIQRFKIWISEAADGALTHRWPSSVILARIAEILADGLITGEERADLLDMLDSLTGGGFDFGAAGGMATTLPVTPVDRVDFHGRAFCLTGRFIYGTRSRCEAAVIKHGGKVVPSITRRLDYLVIGGLASRDWAQTSYGRKIEKAVAARDAGQRLFILSEDAWATHLVTPNSA